MSKTTLLTMLLATLIATPALAGDGISAIERRIWEDRGFLASHPDVAERKRGFWLLQQAETEAAVEAFRRAARYADKPSMAMLAELYWEGRLVGGDRAAAYAWMDLAGERGYPLFLAKRERYWAALNAHERDRALVVGGELYAEFGDDVAKPRLAALLQRGRFDITGSRVGHVGALSILVEQDGVLAGFDGSSYYQKRFWQADDYFAFTDRLWSGWPQGEVEVGQPTAQPTRGEAK